MKRLRYGFIVLCMVALLATSASAQISVGIGIGLPNLQIGINLPGVPLLAPVPGYPVYYAPQVDGNYFFYDGMYWAYQDDNWYASSWYNGPWGFVEPEFVPVFILRIPVAYYRHRPSSFRGWHSNEPPRWGDRWGHDWEQRRDGWNRWDRHSPPQRAPRPEYQRHYSGDRYPKTETQQTLHNRNYRYQPRETVVREHYQKNVVKRAPAPAPQHKENLQQGRNPRPQGVNVRQQAPAAQHQQPVPKMKEGQQRSHQDEKKQDQRYDEKNKGDREHDRRD